MKVRSLFYGILCMLAIGTLTVSCSDDDEGWDDTGSTVELPHVRAFILNEGSLDNNNAGLAFYAPNRDASRISDIFYQQNGYRLGDTGQHMIEYDGHIYISIYGSNYLVKLNAAGVEQARLSFVNDSDLSAGIRELVADDGYIYASFCGGAVAKINANTLALEKKLTGLGGNLEYIVECEDKLYVAESWARVDGKYVYYDNVHVIDPKTLTEIKTIKVRTNPNQLLEEDDKVFVISWDYSVSGTEGYVLQVIDPAKNDQVTEIGNASLFAAYDDTLYGINSLTDWSDYPNVKVSNTFFTYNIKTGQKNNSSFLKNAPAELSSTSLYMMTINEHNGDIYIGTSDYSTNGTIYRFDRNGNLLDTFDSGGLNPNAMVFFE